MRPNWPTDNYFHFFLGAENPSNMLIKAAATEKLRPGTASIGLHGSWGGGAALLGQFELQRWVKTMRGYCRFGIKLWHFYISHPLNWDWTQRTNFQGRDKKTSLDGLWIAQLISQLLSRCATLLVGQNHTRYANTRANKKPIFSRRSFIWGPYQVVHTLFRYSKIFLPLGRPI